MTINLQEFFSKAVTGHDKSRARSVQTAVGPSAIGGCRRRVWHDLKQTPITNPDTDSLAAIMGTYIHAGIAEAMKREDPFNERFLIEHRIEVPDVIVGNVDLFMIKEGIVIDWKTTKMKSQRYFPNKGQLYQVHVYGWLLEQNGYKVNHVSLVSIARDGEMGDVRTYIEPYDPAIAKEGLDWLQAVRDIVSSNAPAPEPEEKIFFCSRYCPYFDTTGVIGCPSMTR